MITPMHSKKYTNSAFTLIELLTVIAIIGILAAILIPAVGAVRQKASQAKSSSNMRQIALAYNNYSTSGGRTRVIGEGTYSTSTPTVAADMNEWALVLAQGAGLVDAAIYLIDGDPAHAAVPELPKLVGSRISDGSFDPNADWISSDEEIIGYAGVVNMSGNANGSTTPLIWTKGLQSSGFWDPSINPWGANGGHIAFMDGHIEYHENIAEPKQLVGNSAAGNAGKTTELIAEAVRSTATVQIYDPSNTL
ncbi:MAG: hypothetical protein CNC89_00640 [Puniceicoccaceae bacterium MED-G31]|nr:MAG: hypothetical protein CNC89_00640 [Puniceicoccaceae bacterium MED-G31]